MTTSKGFMSLRLREHPPVWAMEKRIGGDTRRPQTPVEFCKGSQWSPSVTRKEGMTEA